MGELPPLDLVYKCVSVLSFPVFSVSFPFSLFAGFFPSFGGMKGVDKCIGIWVVGPGSFLVEGAFALIYMYRYRSADFLFLIIVVSVACSQITFSMYRG
jgi:hypothetical protein